MRKLLFILLIFPFIVGAAPSRLYEYVTGTTILSDAVGGNEDAIFNYLQSGVEVIKDGVIINADINSSAAITADKLDLGTITQNMTHSGTLTQTGTIDLSGATITAGFTVADITATTADINGGTLDGVQIGGTTATGELIVNNSSDDADGLGTQGTAGQVLTSAGTGANPTWGSVTNIEIFTSDGTFTANASTTVVYLSMVGGGGGGGAGGAVNAGTGGGGGGMILNMPYTVSPSTGYAVDVGTGGTGGTGGGSGGDGADTTFNTVVIAKKGLGGETGGGTAGVGGGGFDGSTTAGGTQSLKGGDGASNATGNAGGGGGTIFGAGGAPDGAGAGAAGDGAANTGAGGGGGDLNVDGGDGGTGVVIVMY